MRAIRGLALLYALGVVLASPVTLHAEDPQQPPEQATTPEAPPPEPAAEDSPPAPTATPAPQPQAPAAAPAPVAPAAAAPAPAPPAKPAAKPPAPAPRAVSAASASVTARDFSFSPATVTVNVGDSVTWTSTGDEPHNAVGDGISTPLLDKGESASESFSQAGSFSYVCTVHPQMTGTVRVLASQSGGGGGSGSSGTGSGSAGGAQGSGTDSQQQTQATGPRLPSSGLDAWLLAGIGIVLLAAGIATRNRLATR